ncbi:hypothetical protein AVEN_83084-1 [Araneus ventricosus]|uniref:Uncharacterized protein n=1 Tax=Araneus ventricosus TaxID=182803 RepID=A0A4Y2AMD9_ARAVE|nr:hypothetical protein AVEN_83084-1 [Araneus ventricosus]
MIDPRILLNFSRIGLKPDAICPITDTWYDDPGQLARKPTFPLSKCKKTIGGVFKRLYEHWVESTLLGYGMEWNL